MAALKKPMRKKDAGKPSIVLICFLVFFILATILAGVVAYYGYEGQNKLKEAAASANKAVTAQKNLDDYRIGIIRMLATALGQEIDADDTVRANAALKEALKVDGSKYNEKDRKIWVDLYKELEKDLAYDGNEEKFKENFRTKYTTAMKEWKDAASQREDALKRLKAEQDKYGAYEAKNETYAKERAAQIAKGNAAASAIAAQKFASFDDLVKANKEIQDQKIDSDTKWKTAEDQLGTEKARHAKFLEALDKKTAGQEVVKTTKDGDQHALILDLSRGIPLWDRPVGKVTRVDLERRQVYINLGSALGVRPELTFNIFADDGKGNADKFLKGSIEVIRVIDGQTSLCRLTSLYDAAGAEIALNDASGSRVAREVEAAVREGDLLFNLFWNTHVAIAGSINFTGFPIDAPSEQMRQIEMFTQLAARMGIHTDAILDLNDGQMKGGFSNKTRFLILGDIAYPKNAGDDAQKERAKVINDGIAAMKKEAVDKGLFLISAENFTIAAGYRKPRNANITELGKFGSTVPNVGSSTTGLVIQREVPGAAAPMPEKKDAEKKLPEAKDKEMK